MWETGEARSKTRIKSPVSSRYNGMRPLQMDFLVHCLCGFDFWWNKKVRGTFRLSDHLQNETMKTFEETRQRVFSFLSRKVQLEMICSSHIQLRCCGLQQQNFRYTRIWVETLKESLKVARISKLVTRSTSNSHQTIYSFLNFSGTRSGMTSWRSSRRRSERAATRGSASNPSRTTASSSPMKRPGRSAAGTPACRSWDDPTSFCRSKKQIYRRIWVGTCVKGTSNSMGGSSWTSTASCVREQIVPWLEASTCKCMTRVWTKVFAMAILEKQGWKVSVCLGRG